MNPLISRPKTVSARAPSVGQQERGVTLWLVILILGMALAASLGASALVLGEIQQTRIITDSVTAFFAADAGSEQALYQLCKQDNRDDQLNQPIGAARYSYRVQGGAGNRYVVSTGSFRNSRRAIEVTGFTEDAGVIDCGVAQAGGPALDFGTGADIFLGPAGNPSGFFSINSTVMIQGRTRPDAVNFPVLSAVAAGADRIDLGVAPNGIAEDDEVLIMVMQGSSSNTADVGLWETQRVEQVSGTRLRFEGTLENAYDGTRYKVMLQRVPNYNSMTIPSHQQFGADPWNSTTGKGGVFFIRVKGLLVIFGPSGAITSAGKGYTGGQGGAVGGGGSCNAEQTAYDSCLNQFNTQVCYQNMFGQWNCWYDSDFNVCRYWGGGIVGEDMRSFSGVCTQENYCSAQSAALSACLANYQSGKQGESIAGLGVFANTNNNFGGGGGSDVSSGSGGGAGHKTSGGNAFHGSSVGGSPGSGGTEYGTDDLSTRLYLGSGGGGGSIGARGQVLNGSGGGNGGGIVYIAAEQISNGGTIEASGANSVPTLSFCPCDVGTFGSYGGAGGGSGGSLMAATAQFNPSGRPSPFDKTGLVYNSGGSAAAGNNNQNFPFAGPQYDTYGGSGSDGRTVIIGD